jgi:nicotinamidase-related amidase
VTYMDAPKRHSQAPADSKSFELSVSNTQILFVDLQPELTKDSETNAPESISANATVLARIAGILGIPMTFSVVPVAGQEGRVLPELAACATEQNTNRRTMAKAFLDRPLVQTLADLQRPVLVIAGYATEVAVLHATLGAMAAGYRVHYVIDVMGSGSHRTESAAFRQMEMAGAIPTSVLTLAAHLAPDFTQPPGADVLKTFDCLRPPR